MRAIDKWMNDWAEAIYLIYRRQHADNLIKGELIIVIPNPVIRVVNVTLSKEAAYYIHQVGSLIREKIE
jgi:hypothetical protein